MPFTSCALALLLLADNPDWRASGEAPPWACGRHLRAGLEKWQRANDLGEASLNLSSTARGERTWAEQMISAPGEDLLGRQLPDFVTRARAIAWTEHPLPDSVDLVTARRWSGVPGERWVILVAGKGGKAGTPEAELMDARLALVEVTGAGPTATVRRIARTTRPLAPCPDWGLLPERFRPSDLEEDTCQSSEMKDRPDHGGLTALDFAPYRLTPFERAFGLRTTAFEGYGGGFATFETLTLFRIEGEVLVPILDVPVGVVKMLAGDWNEDGTRQHETISADLVIDVRARGAGTADLLLRSRSARQGLLFSWDRQRHAYRCGR